MEFGKRLKAARKAAGFTQARLGEFMDVDGVTVARWESGEFLPRKSAFPDLCRILAKDPAYFAGSDTPKASRSIETLAAEIDRQAAEIARLKREAGLTGFKRELFDLIASLDEPNARGLVRIIRRALEILREDKIDDISQYELLRKKSGG